MMKLQAGMRFAMEQVRKKSQAMEEGLRLVAGSFEQALHMLPRAGFRLVEHKRMLE